MARLTEHERSSALRLEAATAAAELQEEMPPEEPAAESVGELIALDPEPSAPSGHPTDAPDAPGRPTAPELGEMGVADTAPAELDARESGFDGAGTRFDRLGVAELKPLGELRAGSARAPAVAGDELDGDDSIDAVDAIDAELFPIFAEEAEELLPQLAGQLRDWSHRPGEAAAPAACMRTLHTLKGGARLAGAMRLGEMAHRLESRIERLLAQASVGVADVEQLQMHGDALAQTFEALRAAAAAAPTEAEVVAAEPTPAGLAAAAALEVLLQTAPPDSALPTQPAQLEPAALRADAAHGVEGSPVDGAVDADASTAAAQVDADDTAGMGAAYAAPSTPMPATATPSALDPIDWSRFLAAGVAVPRKAERGAQVAQSAVRVRAPLLDRLVNQAGEVSITRSRIETGVAQIKGSLADLTENLERLRSQLREIEFQGETQMSSRLEAAKAASQAFDPLEFDRFTRFQELARMMAESVNDVATVQRSVQRSLEVTEDELVAQGRLTRDLQDDLLRTRMVEFDGLSDRLYRVVRQTAKQTGKSVRLDMVGGSIEVDRGVLDRMTGAFEHLLRNCVTHGIEAPEARVAAGKDATGSIIVALAHDGNEVAIEFRDDGAGLNLERIRARGVALGLIDANAQASDAELANLIFAPGFSTADAVTELAGRGVGMDVVRSEVNAIGGRVETATAAGQGTSFRMILPLTTAVTQVVMLRCGEINIGVPSTLVEIVRRATPAEIDAAYASGAFDVGEERALQFFWLGALLEISPRPSDSAARMRAVVVIRSAQQRIALHVDEVLGNQEVVVKNLGPQLSRLPGLAGITLLASGAVALIYNPVALATLYGDAAQVATQTARHAAVPRRALPVAEAAAARVEPLVMVVDDSLTVRRVTQRLLLREGYRVVLAKDGLDALERLAEEVPRIVLSDIEMPRMDGFDLVRNMRADARLRDLPVIMITSRIAQKHRDYAAELGVDHYLGKPYSEEDLLALIGRYTAARVPA